MGKYGDSLRGWKMFLSKKTFETEEKMKKSNQFLSFKARERGMLIGKSVLITVLLDCFFYRSLWALLPLAFVGATYYRMEREILFRKKKEQVREQFKELMLMVSNGQKAGYSAENAFLSSYGDMRMLYGRDSSICRMLEVLRAGRENNVPLADLWREMGEQTGIAEICEFAAVYEISHKSSGNMASVMERTAAIIISRMETDQEIRILLSARKLEQRIMNGMPFLIMLYVNITSPGYFAGLYHNALGIVVMSICLSVYLGAYILSLRIVSIEI